MNNVLIILAAHKQAVFAHEIGYAFGLSHCSSTARIMYPNDKMTARKPALADLQTINHLY